MSETAKNRTTAAAETPSPDYVASFRGYLRITSDKHDGEIKDLVNAARGKLALGGVLPVWTLDEGDALIKKAISTYIKGEFGLDNEDSEKYRVSFEAQKIALALSTKYTTPPTTAEGEGA